MSKVKAISGDIAGEGLKLSVEDERTLVDSVQIIFHIAAVVRFDANLADAVNLNVNGTLRLLELATKMTKLEVRLLLTYPRLIPANSVLKSSTGSRMKFRVFCR